MFHLLLIAPLIFTIAPQKSSADQSEKFKIYTQNWKQAQEAHFSGDYDTAIVHYRKVIGVMPFEPSSRFFLARCYAKLGKNNKAFAQLSKAVEFGWDDPDAFRSEKELNPLQEDGRFATLVEASRTARNEKWIVHAGKSVNPKTASPVLIVFHGRGGNARVIAPYWKKTAENSKVILVAIHGPHRLGKRLLRLWSKKAGSPNLDDIESLIDDALKDVEKKHRIDRTKIVLAGFSMGGNVALGLLGRKNSSYCGAIALCTVYSKATTPNWKKIAKRQNVKVVLIAGPLDKRWLSDSRTVKSDLQQAGISFRYDEPKGMGHEFPDEYDKHFTKAVKYILGK